MTSQELFSREEMTRLPESNWELPDLGNVQTCLRHAKRLAIDVETKDTGLSELGPGVRREGNFIAGVALGIDGGPRFYLPVRHGEGGSTWNFAPRQVFNTLQTTLKGFEGEVVGANLVYDLDWLAAYGVTLNEARAFLDVQVAEPLLDETLDDYSLDAIAWRRLGEHKNEELLRQAAAAYGFKKPRQIKENIWRLHPRYVGPYAEADVDLPLRVLPRQEEQLERGQLLGVWHLESELVPLMLEMRRRGVRVDVDRAREVRAEMERTRDERIKEMRRLTGREVRLWEPQTIAPLLDLAGIEVPRTPKTGQPSITKPFLEAYAGTREVDLLLDARRYDKAISTFIDGHVLGNAVNGRVHATFHQLRSDEGGTVSGRFSCSNPNLQQLPARDPEMMRYIRSMFLPEEGEVWEALDYSQIEFRLLAHYARGGGADDARQAYVDDPTTSFHKLAASLAGMDPSDKPVYKRVKNTNFCKVYGGGAAKIAETAGMELQEAYEFVEKYDARLPFVSETNRWVADVASRRGWIKSLSGRVHRFPWFEPRRSDYPVKPLRYEEAVEKWGTNVRRSKVHKALNSLLQGGAADIMKEAMRQYRRSGCYRVLGAPLVTVHDEKGLSRPRTREGEEALRETKRIMERAYANQLRVPILVEREAGDTWGTAEEVE